MRMFKLPLVCCLALVCCARAHPQAAALGDDAVPGLIQYELRGEHPRQQGFGKVIDAALAEDDEFGDPFRRESIIEAQVDPAEEADILAKLRANADVIWAEPVVRVSALWLPDDPDFSKQWHLKAAGAQSAWDVTRGEGVTVAVIDTGIAPVDDLDPARLVPGWNFVANNADAKDDNGHGTHVAGTIAQSTGNGKGVAGMAPLAKLMPIKVLSASGGGNSHDIAAGIRWAVDHGARVLNLSLGGGGRSLAMESAVDYAKRRGVLVVCAAGNSGSRGVSYPAAYSGSLAVSAVGPQGTSAPYTTYGPEVAIAAPGGDKSQGEEAGVLQQTIAEGDRTASAYRWFQGTSMATPHVAGAAALVESLGINDPGAVQRLLTSTAKTPPESSAEKYGAGLLDAAAAVRKATLQFGLWRLALALLGAFFAIKQARSMQHLRASDKPGALFYGGLAFGAGAFTMLAPLGLFEKMHALTLFAVPPAAWPARFLPAVSGYIGWSALLPLLLALPARISKRPLQTAFGALAAGLAFGQAGTLLHAAIFRTVDLPWMPSLLTPFWLLGGAFIAWVIGRGLFSKEALQ
ncbi:MAG TPA: S8 family peptidase [Myxococcales bacterium]|nr:S8 family peptidase [Myxococcales bacterium]